MRRREFAAIAVGAAAGLGKDAPIPIIDSHIHLFDPSRPQGVPYGRGMPAALPERYRNVASPFGIVGAIQVEASPWVEDNLWMLETIERDKIMAGAIGNLEPEKPEFREYLGRYHKNKLYLGIRYGNLWGRNLATAVAKPEFIAGMKDLAAADLTLDTANPRFDLIEGVVRLTDRVPELRVVLDHLPSFDLPAAPEARKAFESNLRELRKRNVWAKISMFVKVVDGKAQLDPKLYKDLLDFHWEIFGEDRVLFASDWPNSSGNWMTFEQGLNLVKPYFMAKGHGVAEKFFWKNSVGAYKWVKRDPRQPGA